MIAAPVEMDETDVQSESATAFIRKHPNAIRTSERAKELARLSHEARRRNAEEKRRMILGLTPAQSPQVTATDKYVLSRVNQVRAQIAKLNQRLDDAIAVGDSKDLKQITESIAKLSDLERILSGRPLPGQRRPGREAAPKRSAVSTGPLE